ncbi:hypothetical protein [Legionella jamestowniensis]|nr:hypothetical protein [Legionella jamestowniensis]
MTRLNAPFKSLLPLVNIVRAVLLAMALKLETITIVVQIAPEPVE